MDTILKVNSLTKKYDDFLLDKISFELKKGYIMGFIGPNGAGKTTTIKSIMNLIKNYEGYIEIFGDNYNSEEISIKDRIGFVYDDVVYYEHMTILQMTNILKRFYKRWDERAFDNYIRDFALDKNKKIESLSRGMKLKYSLAIALSHNADLLVLDEPTSGLDPVFRSELLDVFLNYIKNGDKSILFSTHITSDLEYTADYITFINNGKIIFSQDRESVFDKYRLIKGHIDTYNENINKLLIGVRKSKIGFTGLCENRTEILSNFSEYIIEKPDLEDIMVYIVKGAKK